MFRIILDTNVFLSALVFGGMAEKFIELVLDGELIMYISPDLVDEAGRKFSELGASASAVKKLNKLFSESGIEVNPAHKVKVCRDPKDNFLLELTEASQADYLITRDKDLLDLPERQWSNTMIIKPEEFMEILRSEGLV